MVRFVYITTIKTVPEPVIDGRDKRLHASGLIILESNGAIIISVNLVEN